jgi:SAM-dependent methyltransferase
MAYARDEQHRYGQHYTPNEVARLLAALAIRSSSDLVFDPSCGDGRLLEQALRVKKQISRRRFGTSELSIQVFGVDRSPFAVDAAQRTGACVTVADFFDVEPGASLNGLVSPQGTDARTPGSLPLEFDAMIGNPPYIRQEVIGARGKRRIEARLARDRAASPDVFWPRWSGRSDIYVYFFAHSIRFLKEDGRLVFLTASSWLDAGYGAALRQFLLNNFRVIAVIESAAESFFADASINTCITVLERETDARRREANPIRFAQLREPLTSILNKRAKASEAPSRSAIEFATTVEQTSVSETSDTHRIRVIPQAELSARDGGLGATGNRSAAADAPWGKFIRADEVYFKVLRHGRSRLRSLARMANVRFGVKTGANEFFYVKEGEPAKGERRTTKSEGPTSRLLALADVALVRRGITTGANEFFYLSRASSQTEDEAGSKRGRRSPGRDSTNGLMVVRDRAGRVTEIETELLSPVVFSLKEIPGVLLERHVARRMLFNCPLRPNELEGTRALEYIERGEAAGYHHRPTCANRDPWYSVTRGMKPAPLIFPSKVGERWLVALNSARVFEDKKLYGVFPARGVSVLALAALLNSTWARYYAEVTCRQMTGAQAIADIDVAVAEQIMLPDPRMLPPETKKKLEAAILELSLRPIYSIFDEVNRPDRRMLDALTLEAIGFGKASERESVLNQLYKAVTELVQARISRSS